MDELPVPDDSKSRNPIKRSLMRSAIQLLVLFVFYVLSIGPMYWQCYSAYHLRGSTFLGKLYLPLVVASQIPIVSDFFDWYIALWID